TRRYQPRSPPQGDQAGQGLLRPPEEHHPHCQAGRREGRAIFLSRPQGAQTHLSVVVDTAHQRRGAPAWAHLWPVHRRLEQSRHRARPQGARRYRRARAADLPEFSRGGFGGSTGLRPEGFAGRQGPGAMTAPELDALQRELLAAIKAASDLAGLEEVRVAALGKKGRVSELMQKLGSMPPEARKSFGQAVNTLKDAVG